MINPAFFECLTDVPLLINSSKSFQESSQQRTIIKGNQANRMSCIAVSLCELCNVSLIQIYGKKTLNSL